MSNYKTKLLQEIKDGFQSNRGKGSIFLLYPIDVYSIIFNFVVAIKNKTPSANVLIATNTFEQRQKVLEPFMKLNEDEQRLYRNQLTVLSKKFINLKYYNKEKYRLVILLGFNTIEDINYIVELEKISTFTFCIMTENLMNTDFTTNVRNILPDIKTTITSNEVRNVLIASPVEEIRCVTYLSDIDNKNYTKYNDYIKDAMTIFGDLNVVNKCRVGDPEKGLSASDVRINLAKENGWSYDIDTTIEFMKNIDAVYNPNAIAERAETIFNILRERRNLVLNNECKIPKILDIVEKEAINNKNKIIIVSKSGEFAHKITEEINKKFGNHTCVDYHDSIPDSYIEDVDGNLITYKTGENKGKPRLFKSRSLSNIYLQYYNNNYSKILSIKDSSDNKLNASSNIVILTSPLAYNIFNLRTRFNNIDFGNNTKVYRIYCKDTIEEIKLFNEPANNLVTIKNEELENINYDSQSGEIIL